MKKRDTPRAATRPGKDLGIVPSETVVLRLFVAGANARSQQAIVFVRHLCEVVLKGHGTLEVVDIYQQPQLARINQIVATPTLIKVLPKPVRRYIGNLASIDAIVPDMRRAPEVEDPP
jgi:circadian clock protein KaiB